MRKIMHFKLLLSGLLLANIAISQETLSSEESTKASKISDEFSVGFDSLYVFRGELLQRESLWLQNSAAYTLSENLSLGLDLWHLKAFKGRYGELDVVPSANFSFGKFEAALIWAHYNYFYGSDGELSSPFNENEIQTKVKYNFTENLSTEVTYSYNLNRFGNHLEFKLSSQCPLTEKFAASSELAVAYAKDYFLDDGFSSFSAKIAADYSLTEAWSLSAYAQSSVPMEALDQDEDTHVYYGVSSTYLLF